MSLTSEKPPKVIGRLHNRLVPSNVGHGAECIEHLCPADPRDAVHGEHIHLLALQCLDEVRVLSRVEEADQGGGLAELGHLGSRWGSHFEHDVGLERVGRDLGAGSFVVGVAEFGLEPGIFFDVNLEKVGVMSTFFKTHDSYNLQLQIKGNQEYFY